MNNDRLPPQSYYIVGNEACERLSYYGVVSILTGYAAMLYGAVPDATPEATEIAKQHAKEIVHWWKGATYFLPLLGAFLADRYWGRYRTILWISLAYCFGHALMSATEGTRWGLLAGLALLAIGSGGIKPCVSAFVGDQFGPGQERQLTRMYGMFYWSINFGAVIAFLGIPLLKDRYGYGIAFAVPGVAMALATLIFYLGRKHYVIKPPAVAMEPPDSATRQADRAALRKILILFAPITVFWALYDQMHTTWVQQGMEMQPMDFLALRLTGESMQFVNAAYVMGFIPLFTMGIYPWLERCGLRPTPLRRIAVGMVICGIAFGIAALFQQRIEAGHNLSIAWQFLSYAVMTIAEILVSITGLELAFAMAPARMKSTIMSLWLLTIAAGNMLAAVLTSLNRTVNAAGQKVPILKTSQEMLVYVALVIVAAGIFAIIARQQQKAAASA